jgi:lipopolysaccharide transport system permease protein
MSVPIRYLKALKENRSLITTFALGELKNRYRNSVLGFFWSILEPLLLLTVLFFVFSSVLKSGIPNFPLYLFLGLIVWNFVSKGTTMGLNSISNKANIVTNVYFQRAIAALSSNITALIMLGLEFVIFGIFLAVYGVMPSTTILLSPYLILLVFMITLGISLPLSVINVLYKDMQFIWNVVLTAGFFVHPIIYNANMLPAGLHEKMDLIPTVKIFEMLQDTVLYGKIPPLYDFAYVTITSIIILAVGYGVYRKFEPRIVEVL